MDYVVVATVLSFPLYSCSFVKHDPLSGVICTFFNFSLSDEERPGTKLKWRIDKKIEMDGAVNEEMKICILSFAICLQILL